MTGTPSTSAELNAIAHEQSMDATRSYALSRHLQVATLVSALAATLSPDFAAFAAVAAFICQSAAFYLRDQGQRKQGVGDEIRRRALLLDALGPFDQTFDLSELLRKVSNDVRTRAAKSLAPDYFASVAASGLVRLRDNLRENCFWNRFLYLECAGRARRFIITLAAPAIAVYLLAMVVVQSSAAVNLTRIFIALMAFLIAYALVADVLAWRSAARTIEFLERRLDAIKQLSEADLKRKAFGDLLAVFSEYTVATSKVAPIPDFVYKKHRDSLNRHWLERESGLTTPLLGPAGTP